MHSASGSGFVQRDLRGNREKNPRTADFTWLVALLWRMRKLQMLKNQKQVFTRLGISLLLLTPLRAQTSPAAPDVAQRRLAHLQHGINASEWFAQVYDPKGYGKEHFESWNTSQDIALIQSLGFDHVRLSVNPQPMFRPGHADEISPEYLGYLDAAVKMILDQGLAVVIDVHPESDFKTKLANEDPFVEQFADYWRSLARHYSTLDANRVFFEILNEPEVQDRYRWSGIQVKLASAIREGAPQHTIIATGPATRPTTNYFFSIPCPTATSFTTSISTSRTSSPTKQRRGE